MAKKIALTIYFNDMDGEVEDIQVTKRFEEEGPLFKMDVIHDTIIALRTMFEQELEQFNHKNSQIGIT